MKMKKVRDGEYIVRWKNGNPCIIAHYSEGVLNGDYKVFHENGQLAWNVNFVEGLMEGNAIEYNEKGEKLHTCFYTHGKSTDIKFYGSKY